jgi:hypothetical protein
MKFPRHFLKGLFGQYSDKKQVIIHKISFQKWLHFINELD